MRFLRKVLIVQQFSHLWNTIHLLTQWINQEVTIYTIDTGLLLMIRYIFLSATQYLIFMCSHMFV